MAQAYGKYKDDTEWREITWGGMSYHAPTVELEAFLMLMRQHFPNIEYKIVDTEDQQTSEGG